MEPIADKIDDLIVQTDDPSQKALLLILQKMESSLHENTGLTRELKTTITSHVDDETKLYHKITGAVQAVKLAWVVIAAMFALIQGGALYMFYEHTRSFQRVTQEVHELQMFRERHESQGQVKWPTK